MATSTKKPNTGMVNQQMGIPDDEPISIGDLMKKKGKGKKAGAKESCEK